MTVSDQRIMKGAGVAPPPRPQVLDRLDSYPVHQPCSGQHGVARHLVMDTGRCKTRFVAIEAHSFVERPFTSVNLDVDQHTGRIAALVVLEQQELGRFIKARGLDQQVLDVAWPTFDHRPGGEKGDAKRTIGATEPRKPTLSVPCPAVLG